MNIVEVTLIVLWVITIIIGYQKYISVNINLYNLSHGLDVLYSNQTKILELTNLKNYVQLVNDENRNIKKEINIEREKSGVVEGKKHI